MSQLTRLQAVAETRPLTGKEEQDLRILQNIQDDLDYALESGDFQAFEDIFEDRDPFEFI